MKRTVTIKKGFYIRSIFAITALILSTSSPRAETKSTSNKIRDVRVTQQQGKTIVSVFGSSRPSFTAFKLSSPKRLVIDIADSQVRGVPSVIDTRTKLVDGVAVSQYSVKGVPVTRVMIGFQKDAAYRVKVKGNTLVASLSGSPSKKLPPSQSENKSGVSRAAIDRAAAEVEKATRQKRAAESALSRIKKQNSQTLKELQKSREETQKAKAAAQRAASHLSTMKRDFERANDRAKKAQASLAVYKSEAQRTAKNAEKVSSSLKATRSEVIQAKKAAEQARVTLDKYREEVERAKKNAANAQVNVKTAKNDAEKASKEMKKAQAALAVYRNEAQTAKRAAEKSRSELDALRSETKIVKEKADKARADLAFLQKQVDRAKAKSKGARENLTTLQQEVYKARKNAEEAKNELRISQTNAAKKHRSELASYQQELHKAKRQADKCRQDALDAMSAAKSEKLKSKKLETKLALLKRQLKETESAKSRAEVEKARATKIADNLMATMNKHKEATIFANREADRAYKEQLTAASNYKKAAKAEQARLLKVLKAKEKETVRAKQRLSETVAERDKTEQALLDARKKLKAVINKAKRAHQSQAQTDSALQEANQRYLASVRAQKLAEERATEARLARADAEKAINKMRTETESEKAKTKQWANERIQDAEKRLSEALAKEKVAKSKLETAKLTILEQERRIADLTKEVATRNHRDVKPVQKSANDQRTQQKNQGTKRDSKKKLTQEEKRLARLNAMRGKTKGNSSSPQTSSQLPRPTIRAIEFENADGKQHVVVRTSSPLEYNIATDANGSAAISFENAKLASMLERTLDVTDFDGIINSVSSFQNGDDVKLEVNVERTAKNSVERKKNELRFVFTDRDEYIAQKTKTDGPLGAKSRTVSREDEGTYAHPFERTAAYGSTGSGKKKKRYTGRRVDLDFKDADIHNILRLLSDVGHVNIITADDVKGTVTIRMRDVAWDHALDIILQAKQLGMVREGNLIRVAPQSVLEKEREMEIARRKQKIALEPLETRLIPVSYATAGELKPRAEDLLSERGKLSVDARTNVIIARDTRNVLNQVEALIRNLDTQTPQVLIESRIVEATSMYTREIGIQWGGDFAASSATGNPTGLAFPNSIGVAGGATDSQTPLAGLTTTPSGQANPNFGVNMPAPVGLNSGGALGITLGSIANNANLSLRLSAMEETGTLRILSSPKILTLDNREAHIEQGTLIPYSQVSAQGVQTSFKEAKLNLTVTPHVTADGSVLLSMRVMRDEPDFNNTGARGDPTILKREAETELLVSDGHTAVIGGIFTRNSGTSFKKVPFLADIPILGWLFKKKSDSDRRSEMLIFITPRIVNRAESIGS